LLDKPIKDSFSSGDPTLTSLTCFQKSRNGAPSNNGAGVVLPADSGKLLFTPSDRPRVAGKFIYRGAKKFCVKGVSYGAFRPDQEKREYHDLQQIDCDFALMASHGINTVRIPHTTPPSHLLDIALKHDLQVIVGLSAEQYVGYLIDVEKKAPDFHGIVREKARSLKGHPALLCYAIGNEIPSSVARYLGPKTIERYLRGIYENIKAEDQEAIVTYVNYPSTEYLQLPFLDVVCFNVYLENQEQLQAYASRLHNIAGDRPLILSEVGLDALRNGGAKQAEVLDWQIRSSFASGCAGVVIFSWTDEWYRAGQEVEDWAFGITDRQRRAKPALHAVRNAFSDVPFPSESNWTRISVAVCSYNGSRTIRETLDGINRLEYPNFEVIVVDDGSTDSTPAIASEYNCQVISTPNAGLSSARNVALGAATGEIIAYIDDDAIPDPHWLHYLAAKFSQADVAMAGGPNIAPPVSNAVAECVNNAPGGPTHVLTTDEIAEHLPGCNMAIRKSCLDAVGGFDPRFRVAGDDVDVCWRLQQKGWKLLFSPGAMVLHHRRDSVRAFWKQQKGYGRAEGMLAQKWPEKFNSAGHHTFSGRLYGRGLSQLFFRRARIHYGTGGFAPFQSLYETAPGVLGSLPLMPEWYLLSAILAGVTLLGIVWKPLLIAGLLAVAAILLSVMNAAAGAFNASFHTPPSSGFERVWRRCLTGLLHLLQPLARLRGRLSLIGSRQRVAPGFVFPRRRSFATWTTDWQDPVERLSELKRRLCGGVVRDGGAHDRWDLEVFGGMFASARMLMAVEDHGAGTQLVRIRSWPRLRSGAMILATVLTCLALLASWKGEWIAGGVFGAMLVVFLWTAMRQAGRATAFLLQGFAFAGTASARIDDKIG
jgi:GT2 family glycosyltransferase